MKRLFSTCMFLTLIILMMILTGNCDNGCNGGGNQQTSANMRVSIKDEVGSSTIPCEARIILTFEPINLTGHDGRNTAFTVDETITSGSPTLEDGQWWTCYYNKIVTPPGLRTGIWRISAQLGNWSAQCERDLSTGNNNANFTLGSQGCTNIGYP